MNNSIDWKFYTNSGDAWKAMLEDCKAAKESIDLEQYIFDYDEVGKEFADVFEEKIKQGVKVRMLLDMVGSYSFFNSSASKKLINQGIEIRWHNIIKPWRLSNFSSWFFRDHKKVLVIDSQIGHVGGIGISEMFTTWRDEAVRVVSPIVYEMQESFNKIWEKAYGKKYIRVEKPRYFIKGFQFLTNSPRFQQRFIYHNLLDNIRNAKKSIYIITPYFVPDSRLFRVLRLAAKRGVEVKIILPGVFDNPILHVASSSYFGRALKSGMKIFKYKSSFIHAKIIIIDDQWSSVGSANLDSLSLLFNYEANLISSNKLFIEELSSHFVNDLVNCQQVILKDWKKRPRAQKILEFLSWPLHKIL